MLLYCYCSKNHCNFFFEKRKNVELLDYGMEKKFTLISSFCIFINLGLYPNIRKDPRFSFFSIFNTDTFLYFEKSIEVFIHRFGDATSMLLCRCISEVHAKLASICG